MESNIKDMLMSGTATADSLRKQFEAELQKAQEEIAAQKAEKKEEELQNCRIAMAQASIDYLIALNVIKEDDVTVDSVDELCTIFQLVEKELMKESAKPAKTSLSDDDILKNFLKFM